MRARIRILHPGPMVGHGSNSSVWLDGMDGMGMLASVSAVVVGGFLLVRRRRRFLLLVVVSPSSSSVRRRRLLLLAEW